MIFGLSPWAIAGAIVALSIYAILVPQVWRSDKKSGFSFFTYASWLAITLILIASLVAKKGNYLMAVAYGLGILGMVVAIARTKAFGWGRTEFWSLVLVGLCVFVWLTAGPVAATIASTLAIVIAGVPQYFKVFHEPWSTPAWSWIGFMSANILSIGASESWAITEWFYPSCCAAATAGVVIIQHYRRTRVPRPSPAPG